METPTYPGLGSLEVNSNYPELPFNSSGSLYNVQDQESLNQESLNQESQLTSFNLESSSILQENSIDNVINPLQTLNTSLGQPVNSFQSCLPASKTQVLSQAIGSSVTQTKNPTTQTNFKRSDRLLVEELTQYYKTKEFADTKVICSDGVRNLHSFILAATSPFLHNIFLEQNLESETEFCINLPDFSVVDLDEVIDVMYFTSQVDLRSSLQGLLFIRVKANKANDKRKCGAHRAKINDNLDEVDDRDDFHSDNEQSVCEKEEHKDSEQFGKQKDGRYVPKEEAETMAMGHFIKDEETKDFICGFCNQNYKSKCLNAMRTHVLSHMKIYIYECEQCGELFRQLANFNRHLKRHKKLELKGTTLKPMGNYHKLETHIFVKPEEGKLIVEAYMQFIPGKRLHSCRLCDYSNRTKKEVYLHCLSKHLKIWLHKCEYCDKGFKQKGNYSKHMRIEHKQTNEPKPEEMTQTEKLSQATDIICQDICKVAKIDLEGKLINFQQGLKLVQNIIEKNLQEGSYKCLLCNKVFPKIVGNCREHIWRTHFNVYLYRCDFDGCGRKLRKLTDFKDHIKQHKAKIQKKEELIASQENSLPNNVIYHLLTEPIDVNKEQGFEIAGMYFYHDPTLAAYKCKLCEFTHNRIQGTRNHVLANHLTQVFLYRCQHCWKRYRYETQFKLHMAIHQEGKFVCSQCGKQLITKRYLEQHEKTAHGNQQFTCTEPGCQYKGKTQVQMDRHCKVYHSNDQSDWHFCEICAKPFPYLNDLKVHVTRCLEGKSMAFKKARFTKYYTKHNEDTFLCLICNHQCKSHRSVIEHIKKAHNILEGAVKYLKCRHAGCKFKTIKEDKLTQHYAEESHM